MSSFVNVPSTPRFSSDGMMAMMSTMPSHIGMKRRSQLPPCMTMSRYVSAMGTMGKIAFRWTGSPVFGSFSTRPAVRSWMMPM